MQTQGATPGPGADLWPPWATPSQWREANASLGHLIGLNAGSLQPLKFMAREIGQRLESVFPAMDRLCRLTCPEWSPTIEMAAAR